MRILLLDAGNTSSYHVMRSLTRCGHEVHLVGGDSTSGYRSKYCGKAIEWTHSQRTDEQPFIESLTALLARTHYDLLLSCSETAAEHIFVHHDTLSEYTECAVPGPAVREVAFNKNAAYRHAQQVGVPIPDIHYPASLDDALRLREAMSYPLVIKGQKGSAAAHVRFVASPAEFQPKYQQVCELERDVEGLPSIQEYVGGDGYVVHMLYYEGEPRAICCHRKDREFPFGGGVTSAATTVDIPELRNEALKMVDSLNWHGLIKVDFKFDPHSNRYKFIEITPRVSASIDITRAAGADQSVLLCDLLQGKPMPSLLSCRAGVHYRWLFPRDLMNTVMQPKVLLGTVPDLFSRDVFFDLGIEDWRPLLYESYRFLRNRDFLERDNWNQLRRAREIQRLFQTNTGGSARLETTH